MLLLILLIMIIGMFVEVTAALLMMIPMFTQVIASLGFNPLYFAIIIIITFCIGAITPPVGITLYVSCGIAKVPLSEAIKPIWPFVFIMLAVAISLYLFRRCDLAAQSARFVAAHKVFHTR
jgi:C4-dicarboxylate transporter DctM subunit